MNYFADDFQNHFKHIYTKYTKLYYLHFTFIDFSFLTNALNINFLKKAVAVIIHNTCISGRYFIKHLWSLAVETLYYLITNLQGLIFQCISRCGIFSGSKNFILLFWNVYWRCLSVIRKWNVIMFRIHNLQVMYHLTSSSSLNKGLHRT